MEILDLDSRCAQRETLEGRAGPVQGLLADAMATPRVAPLPPRRTPTLTLDFSAMGDDIMLQSLYPDWRSVLFHKHSGVPESPISDWKMENCDFWDISGFARFGQSRAKRRRKKIGGAAAQGEEGQVERHRRRGSPPEEWRIGEGQERRPGGRVVFYRRGRCIVFCKTSPAAPARHCCCVGGRGAESPETRTRLRSRVGRRDEAGRPEAAPHRIQQVWRR